MFGIVFYQEVPASLLHLKSAIYCKNHENIIGKGVKSLHLGHFERFGKFGWGIIFTYQGIFGCFCTIFTHETFLSNPVKKNFNSKISKIFDFRCESRE